MARLKEVAALSFPCEFPWKGDAIAQRKFYEATSQLHQLISGLGVLRQADRQNGVELLGRICKGAELPPDDPEVADEARNRLFELATAAALHNAGFEVQVPPPGREDLRATYPGLLPFIVECKRPTHDDALARSVKQARHQLRRRASEQTYGLAVFGVDRSLGLAGAATLVASEPLLRQGADRELLRQKLRIDAIQARGEPLYPHARIAGVLLVGAVSRSWPRPSSTNARPAREKNGSTSVCDPSLAAG